MKTLKLLVLVIVVAFTGYFSSAQAAIFPSNTSTRTVTNLRPFHNIVLDMPVTATIIDNNAHPAIQISGPTQLISQVSMRIKKNTLILQMPHHTISPSYVHLKINLHQLNCLALYAVANVNVLKHRANPFIIKDHHAGSLLVNGRVNLAQFIYDGSANVTINNINTPQLKILARGTGNVLLQGSRVALQSVFFTGQGNLTVKNITHDEPLTVNSNASGNLFLTGRKVNLYSLNYNNRGNVTIQHINSQYLKTNIAGSGAVDLSGKMNLKQFTYSGPANVHITGIDSDGLSVYAQQGAGNVFLMGKINLFNLIAGGTVNFYIEGINSGEMMVDLHDNAKAHLTGNARILNARTNMFAVLDGYYLAVDEIYVKTLGASKADVRPINLLTAYAKDNSNVYYYQQPKFIAPYMNLSGSVLPMFDAAPPYPIYWDKAGEYTPRIARADFEHNFYR